jgi:DNA-binding NarL/FixJ family response regulator
MDDSIRLMLVDRDDCSRVRLAAAIAADPRLLLADCLGSGVRALQRLALVRPDALLFSTRLAELDVAEFVRDARRTLASCDLLAIVCEGDEEAALECMAAGAAGCLPKFCAGSELHALLLQLRAGACPMPQAVTRLLLERMRGPAPQKLHCATGTRRFTPREVQVLRMLALDHSYHEVGEELGISLHTVATHIKSAYRKLDVHSAGAAVMRAVQLRLIET